jgi:hypothetical protein
MGMKKYEKIANRTPRRSRPGEIPFAGSGVPQDHQRFADSNLAPVQDQQIFLDQ